MELKDWLSTYFERSRALQYYWNFFIIVAIGVTGFAVKALASDQFRLRIVLAGAFFVFAIRSY